MTTPDAEPTTKEERDDTLKRRGKHTGRLLYGPKTMMGRLIVQVERLEAERDRLREQVTEYQDQAAWREKNRLSRLP